MSKEIIAARKAEEKAARVRMDIRQKLAAQLEMTAKDARQLSEIEGAKTAQEQVDASWATVMAKIKEAASQGLTYIQVPNIPIHDPAALAEIAKRLERAGFRHQLVNSSVVTAYIYW